MWRPSGTRCHAWPKPVLSVAAWITACARPQSSGNRAQPGGGGSRSFQGSDICLTHNVLGFPWKPRLTGTCGPVLTASSTSALVMGCCTF
eukprot:6255089-Pyramimonas_sp.AAC.1